MGHPGEWATRRAAARLRREAPPAGGGSEDRPPPAACGKRSRPGRSEERGAGRRERGARGPRATREEPSIPPTLTAPLLPCSCSDPLPLYSPSPARAPSAWPLLAQPDAWTLPTPALSSSSLTHGVGLTDGRSHLRTSDRRPSVHPRGAHDMAHTTPTPEAPRVAEPIQPRQGHCPNGHTCVPHQALEWARLCRTCGYVGARLVNAAPGQMRGTYFVARDEPATVWGPDGDPDPIVKAAHVWLAITEPTDGTETAGCVVIRCDDDTTATVELTLSGLRDLVNAARLAHREAWEAYAAANLER